MKIYELLISWFRAILGTVILPKILKNSLPSYVTQNITLAYKYASSILSLLSD